MFKKKTDFEKAVAEQRRIIAAAAVVVEAARAVADKARAAWRALPDPLSQLGKVSRVEFAELQVRRHSVTQVHNIADAKLKFAQQRYAEACEALAEMERAERERQQAAAAVVADAAAVAANTAGLQSNLAAAIETLELAKQRVSELEARMRENGERLTQALSDTKRPALITRAKIEECEARGRSIAAEHNTAFSAMQTAQKNVDTLEAALERAKADAVKLAERYGKAETAVRGYAEEFRATAIANFKQALRNARNSAELTVANTRATIETATSKTGSDAEALLTRNGVHIAELQRQIIKQAVQDVITAISSELQE